MGPLLLRTERDHKDILSKFSVFWEAEAQRRERTFPVNAKYGIPAQAPGLQAPLHDIWISEIIWSNTSFIVELTEAQREQVTQPRGARYKDEGSLPLLFIEEKRKYYLSRFCAETIQPISWMITPTSFDFFQHQRHFAVRASSWLLFYSHVVPNKNRHAWFSRSPWRPH